MHLTTDSREACETHIAQLLAQKLTELVKQKGKAILGLSGEKDLAGIYHKLLSNDVPWKQVHIFLIDERCVSFHSLESSYKLLYDTLIQKLVQEKKLPEANVHPLIYNEAHAIKAILKYNQTLEGLGGFDVILASSGEDGHIAALFPNHHSLQKENVGFFMYKDAPKLPLGRMTASRKLLLRAKTGILVVFGKEKEKAWNTFNDITKTLMHCPAKLITQLPEAYVFHSNE